jgi:hypothetical protein
MCTMYEGVDVAGATMQSLDCHSGVLGPSYTSCGVYTWHAAFVLDMKQCNDSKFKVHLDQVYAQSEEYDVKPTKRHRYALYDRSLFMTFFVVHMVRQLPVYFIKRPGVFEAAQKHLIYNVACMRLILDARTSHHTQGRSSPDTLLQLLRYAPLILCEEFPRKPTLAAQGTGPNLQTGLVSEILVLHLELEMVPRMHHFMCHGVFLVAAVAKLVGAQQDAVVQAEAAALLVGAHATHDVLVVEVAAEFAHLVLQEAHHGRVFEEVGSVVFAALADDVGLELVHFAKVVLLESDVAGAGHAAEHDAECAGPVVVDRVELFGRRGCRHGGDGRAVGGLLRA